MSASGARWWLNFDEDGFLAYWFSLPRLCRMGLHRSQEVEWREYPDYPWIVDTWRECSRCGRFFGRVE